MGKTTRSPAKRSVRSGKSKPTGNTRSKDDFRVVGIGASAGGLEALSELLKNLGSNPSMAFVVIQHLDPTHESSLPALLARLTKMPVVEAANNTHIKNNSVYVIPPNKAMQIIDGKLKVMPRKTGKDIHMPVNRFLQSLAKVRGDKAVGVILSGNGSDGTSGLTAIKSAGGITFAQDDRSAKYTGMPSSAIAAGCVDFVLPPSQIAKELVSLASRPSVEPLPLVPTTSKSRGEERAFEEILAMLRLRVGVDFTNYKRPTLDRRIRHRLAMQKLNTLRQYSDYLRAHQAEVQELFNDILIHVTGFFRDPAAFTALKKRAYPRMFKGRPVTDPIRIWVPGCSTGEEVYSIAISLLEYMAEHKSHHSVQIFGTDINTKAMEKGRSGIFPSSIAADIAPARLRKFFVKVQNGYRINKAVREMCIFARQNVVVDPPFSNLDLISCRNVLIYLGQQLQRKAFPVFHYALKPTGMLLLGASETIGGFDDLFRMLDNKNKIYVKKTTLKRPAMAFDRTFSETQLETAIPAEARAAALPRIPLAEIQRQADRITLAHFAPTGVVVNRRMDVLHFRGKTGRYLEHPQGEATLDLIKMAREGLAIDLRAALNRAIKNNERVRQMNIRVGTNGGTELLNIEVVPFAVPPEQDRFYLVIFEPAADPKAVGKLSRRAPVRSQSRELQKLNTELASTRESLQAIIEEQEATNEELRSANEEIMSSNEELQSTNEEMETAKEELQSTNEELSTLNDELESRNSELESVNNDLHNLLASVNIPIIMIGPDLRIRRFTSISERILNVIPSDIGRPITDINIKMELHNLEKLIHEVAETLQTKEIETRDGSGRKWSVRIRPYKTTDNKIDGVVLAFVELNN